jgi:hypothetical protein
MEDTVESAFPPASSGFQGNNSDGNDNTSGNDIDGDIDIDALLGSRLVKSDELIGTAKRWHELETDTRTICNKLWNRESTTDQPTKDFEGLTEVATKISNLKKDAQRLGLRIDWNLNESFNLCMNYVLFKVHVADRICEIKEKNQEVYDRLKGFSVMADENRTIGTKTFEFEEENRLEEGQYLEMMKGVHIPSLSEADKISEKSDKIGPWWPEKVSRDGLLAKFSKYWCHLFKYSKKHKETGFTKDLVSGTTKAILEWKDRVNKLYPEEPLSKRPKLSEQEKSSIERFFNKIDFPTPYASETVAVQPILRSLFRVLSQILPESDESSDESNSNARIDQRRERYIPKFGKRPSRFVDVESSKLQPCSPVLLDDEFQLLKEMKTVFRSKEHAEDLYREVRDQIVGHLAKRALAAFQTADVGIDSASVGLIITPLYMQVIRLEVNNVGTKSAEVKILYTDFFPLVNKGAFDAFVSSHIPTVSTNVTYAHSIQYLQDNLKLEEHGVPTGIKYLWQLLHSSDEELGVVFFHSEGQSEGQKKGKREACFIPVEQVAEGEVTEYKLGALLGSGSHGLVFAQGDNLVAKASAIGESIYIKKELIALNALKGTGAKHRDKHIPKLHYFGCVQYTIGDSIVNVPALLMEPRGKKPALSHLSSSVNDTERDERFIELWRHMNDALAYAHEKHIVHLDVSPSNIIYTGENFVLIDWSCAATTRTRTGEEVKVKGFYGTLPFAHAEIHKQGNTDEWTPTAKHDKASLLFTLYALFEGTPVPWSGFDKRLDEHSSWVLETRRNDTKKFVRDLEQLGKNQDQKVASLSFLGPDKSTKWTRTAKKKVIEDLCKQLEGA